jgi:hypothetical protein
MLKYDNNMECASRACALLKHGFSNPNMLPEQKIYAWQGGARVI